MPTSWLCQPRRWIVCRVRDSRRRGRHSPRPIVGVPVARDRDRDAEDGGMTVVGIDIRETLHLPRRWDSHAVCLRRVRRQGQRETPRRLRLKPPVRASETAGLCRPREPESPAPQGNPRPRRHNDEVGMTVVRRGQLTANTCVTRADQAFCGMQAHRASQTIPDPPDVRSTARYPIGSARREIHERVLLAHTDGSRAVAKLDQKQCAMSVASLLVGFPTACVRWHVEGSFVVEVRCRRGRAACGMRQVTRALDCEDRPGSPPRRRVVRRSA